MDTKCDMCGSSCKFSLEGLANENFALKEQLAETEKTIVLKRLGGHLDEAKEKAIDSLGRYKFQMFGYWAAIWVHLNRIGELKRPNPFKEFVDLAKKAKENE